MEAKKYEEFLQFLATPTETSYLPLLILVTLLFPKHLLTPSVLMMNPILENNHQFNVIHLGN
eukprot:scaffold5831_cov40-Cyclotella_meneghiniana.AAC.5